MKGSVLRVEGSLFRVRDLRVRVWGLGFRF